MKTIQDPTIELVVKRAVEGSWCPQVHMLAQRVIQDEKIPGGTPPEKLFYVCQRVIKYHPDPITAEMLIWPQEMARQLWDYMYEGSKVQPMGDCDDKTCMMLAFCFNRRYTAKAVGAWQSQYSNVKQINHVYPELKVNDQTAQFIRKALPSMAGAISDYENKNIWIPLETSSTSLSFGQQRKEVVPLKDYIARVDGYEIS